MEVIDVLFLVSNQYFAVKSRSRAPKTALELLRDIRQPDINFPAKLGVELDNLIVFRRLSKVLVVKNGLKEDGFSFDGTTLSARFVR